MTPVEATARGKAEPRLWGWHVGAHQKFGGAGVGGPGAESGEAVWRPREAKPGRLD